MLKTCMLLSSLVWTRYLLLPAELTKDGRSVFSCFPVQYRDSVGGIDSSDCAVQQTELILSCFRRYG